MRTTEHTERGDAGGFNKRYLERTQREARAGRASATYSLPLSPGDDQPTPESESPPEKHKEDEEISIYIKPEPTAATSDGLGFFRDVKSPHTSKESMRTRRRRVNYDSKDAAQIHSRHQEVGEESLPGLVPKGVQTQRAQLNHTPTQKRRGNL